MAEVKWIKITTDVFEDEKIRLLETMPEGDALVCIWFKLLCLAGKSNHSGMLMLSDRIAYTDEMLATIFRKPLQLVKLAMDVFVQFGMIEIIEDRYIIANWEKHQNAEKLEKIREQTRERMAKYRENKRLEECNANVALQERNKSVTGALQERYCYAAEEDIEEDKEREEEGIIDRQVGQNKSKRQEAMNNSSLPYSFTYKIRQAFIGEECPVCHCRMGVVDVTDDDPVRVPSPYPSIQHNIPISKGGKHELENISVICERCNERIQNKFTGDLNNELVRKKWEEICKEEQAKKNGAKDVNDNVNDMSMTKEKFNRDERGKEEEKKKEQKEIEEDKEKAETRECFSPSSQPHLNSNYFQEKENAKEKEGFFEETPSYPNSIVSEFNELWKLYPKKEGRQTAFYAYQRARRDGATFEQVKKGIEDYIKFIKETNRGMEFVAQGKTWFNQRRWEDKHEYNKSQESVAGYEVNDFFRMAMEAGLKGVEK